jgi:hypothetical protein
MNEVRTLVSAATLILLSSELLTTYPNRKLKEWTDWSYKSSLPGICRRDVTTSCLAADIQLNCGLPCLGSCVHRKALFGGPPVTLIPETLRGRCHGATSRKHDLLSNIPISRPTFFLWSLAAGQLGFEERVIFEPFFLVQDSKFRAVVLSVSALQLNYPAAGRYLIAAH